MTTAARLLDDAAVRGRDSRTWSGAIARPTAPGCARSWAATRTRPNARPATAAASSPRRWRSRSHKHDISEVCDFSISEAARWFGGLERDAHRQAERHRAAHPQGDQRAARLPEECRARLPDPVARLGHACRAARASASAWPRRSARASPACSMSSTSRRSACTSATTTRLLETLKRLRDLGNTVIVVEHDEEAIRAAD